MNIKKKRRVGVFEKRAGGKRLSCLPLLACFVVLLSLVIVACTPSGGTAEQTTADASTSATTTSTQETISKAPISTEPETEPYKFGDPLPEREAVGDDYFDDALFIGNSITDTFMMFSGLENATFYAGTSMTVRSAYSKPIISDDGDDITIMDAVKKHKFKKVYIMFGFNELGWETLSVFIDEYGKLIDDVKKYQPDAVIYVESILPVSKEKSDDDEFENNENIVKFNGLIRDIAAEKEVHYLDIHEEIVDDNGCLPDEASHDGVHFNQKYCLKWLDYLKRHTADN